MTRVRKSCKQCGQGLEVVQKPVVKIRGPPKSSVRTKTGDIPPAPSLGTGFKL